MEKRLNNYTLEEEKKMKNGKIQLTNAKKRRLIAGLTSKEASEKLGITKQALSTYECGLNTPTVPRLKKMAEIYGCTIDELF